MRLIDADKLIDDYNKSNGTISDLMELILDAAEEAKPPNAPLTLEQLREMDGEPVWMERNGCDAIWALVHVWAKPTNIIFLVGNTGEVLNLKVELDCGAKIYRKKPEEGTNRNHVRGN